MNIRHYNFDEQVRIIKFNGWVERSNKSNGGSHRTFCKEGVVEIITLVCKGHKVDNFAIFAKYMRRYKFIIPSKI